MTPRALTGLIATALAIILAAVLVPAALGRHDNEPRPGITDYGRLPDRPGTAQLVRVDATLGLHPVEPAQVARPEQDFSFALLSALAAQAAQAQSGTNTTVSPASLAITLSMLQFGARGQTAREIAVALHTAGTSADTQGDGWHVVAGMWARAAKEDGLTVDTANSLWQQAGKTIPRAYLTALAAYFDTGVWQTDFAGNPAGAVAALNNWTSEHTHGKIAKLFDDGTLDRTTQLVLANAVYFKAAWAHEFDANQTQSDTFTKSDGTTVDAEFMHGDLTLRCAVTKDYQAVELPYTGGRFAALAIMPTAASSGSLSAFISSMSGAKLASIVAGLDAKQIRVALPSFETTSAFDLKAALQQLGMRTAFTPQADLSGIGPDLHVQQAVQRTYLKVAEKGTEAAAVTAVGGAGASAQASTAISFNQPFLFLIRDTVTGTLLFTSQIENPQL